VVDDTEQVGILSLPFIIGLVLGEDSEVPLPPPLSSLLSADAPDSWAAAHEDQPG
jgi:hypothetical protein